MRAVGMEDFRLLSAGLCGSGNSQSTEVTSYRVVSYGRSSILP